MATIPDALPPEYTDRTRQAAEPGAADGLGLRQAPHDRRARPRLAEEIRELRAPAGGRRVARPGASRPLARRRRAGLQAAISGHAVGGRGRSAAAAMAVRDPSPHGSGDRHHARSPRRSARACARSSTIGARPSTSRSTAPCWPASKRSACRGHGRSFRPAGCSRSTGSRAAGCSPTRTPTLAIRNRLATAMFTAWWFPFSRFGVIHGDPHLGNYTVFDAGNGKGAAVRHQPARLRLHPHLPAEIRRRRGRSLQRSAARRRGARRARLRDLGLQAARAAS